jgi:hypothetical protein
MRPVSARIAIDVPRERVLDLLCDLAVRPAFTDHFMSDYRLERLDPVGVGASARFRLRGSGTWLDTVIEAVERPHLIREGGCGGRSNRVPVFTVWELLEGEWPEGCEVSVTFWSEPASAADKARELGGSRQFRRDWKRALARLKEIVEAEAPMARVSVAGADRLPAFSD